MGLPRPWSQSAAQLARASLLGVTFMFALLGSAASWRSVSVGRLLFTLLGAVAFHIAVYVANDIVDLPIDRTEPRRAASPLVQGTTTVHQMAVVAATSVVVAVVIAAVLDVRAVAAMTVALAMLLAYDVWGKRCPVPPLTDLVQGVGWACLVWYGSEAAGAATRATVELGIYVVVAIVLVNGVHGAVRDLANDQAHGARTTARWLGGHLDAQGAAHIPRRLWVYAVALHVADVAVLLVALATAESERSEEFVIVVVVGAACLGMLWTGLAHAGQPGVSWRAGFGYIIGMMLLPATLVVDHLRGVLLLATVVLFAVPWAGSRYVRTTLATALRAKRHAVR